MRTEKEKEAVRIQKRKSGAHASANVSLPKKNKTTAANVSAAPSGQPSADGSAKPDMPAFWTHAHGQEVTFDNDNVIRDVQKMARRLPSTFLANSKEECTPDYHMKHGVRKLMASLVHFSYVEDDRNASKLAKNKLKLLSDENKRLKQSQQLAQIEASKYKKISETRLNEVAELQVNMKSALDALDAELEEKVAGHAAWFAERLMEAYDHDNHPNRIVHPENIKIPTDEEVSILNASKRPFKLIKEYIYGPQLDDEDDEPLCGNDDEPEGEERTPDVVASPGHVGVTDDVSIPMSEATSADTDAVITSEPSNVPEGNASANVNSSINVESTKIVL